jgi:hypothetical protein
VRHDESKVSDVITQMGGMRQGCGFSIYFFNRSTDIMSLKQMYVHKQLEKLPFQTGATKMP